MDAVRAERLIFSSSSASSTCIPPSRKVRRPDFFSFTTLPARPSVVPNTTLGSSIARKPFSLFRVSASSSSSSTTVVNQQGGLQVKSIPTKSVEGQKTGTSGLRRKVKVFVQENYLANWIQALFNSLPPEDYKNGVLVLGGDGRYFNEEAAQTIIKIAAGNGVGKVLVGRDGIMSTPAVSAVIRERKANGGFIMSASHNPGGPENDWGIKFNYSSGQPAPETITDKIYGNTLLISEIKLADFPDIDLSKLGVSEFGSFSVEVIDPVSDYLDLLESVFDFELMKSLLTRSDFRM